MLIVAHNINEFEIYTVSEGATLVLHVGTKFMTCCILLIWLNYRNKVCQYVSIPANEGNNHQVKNWNYGTPVFTVRNVASKQQKMLYEFHCE